MIKARLAIDVRYAAAPLSGFGRFTWNLLEGLASIGPPEPMLMLRRPGQIIPSGIASAPGFAWQEIDRAPYGPLGQRKLAQSLSKAGATVMVSPDVFAPLGSSPKQVITLHDIIPLRCPEMLNRSAKGRFSWAWRQWLKLQLRNAKLVLTVSEHARRDIALAFGGTDQKLRTIYNAVPKIDPIRGQARTTSGGPARLLYVGRTAPYKNIVGCIETLSLLREDGIDAVLMIVGEPDPRYPEVGEAVQQLGLDQAVTFTGHVSDDQLRDLYRDASVFLFLSHYEGFGLPPLEAMAHGVPVVSSDRTSMPEVLGDAALLVNPDDTKSAAAAVRRIIEQPDLAAELHCRGRKRAAIFSTERQAIMFWDAVSPLL
ncbi:MAG: glycosyltransferase family 4 protein [Geminicoccaceae bacterium]